MSGSFFLFLCLKELRTGRMDVRFISRERRIDILAKKKIHRLNKEWYVSDEYGHTDKILVQKVNELIGIVNHQQEVIHNFELMMKNRR